MITETIRKRRAWFWFSSFTMLICIFVGACDQGAPRGGSAENGGGSSQSDGDDAELSIDITFAEEDGDAQPGAGSDNSPAADAAADSLTVTLGTTELAMGIPGEGALTTDQIQEWLARPENHEVLKVELPLGLAAGISQIQGLDQNPLTRAKIELGRQLYFDRRLSADGTVSCADCHHPDEGYTRHTQFGVGIRGQTGDRNSPVSYNRILSGAQFWDGRAATLEDQAKGPIENPIEMGNTHDRAVKTVQSIEGYRLQFEKTFPDEGISIDTIAKAIASFERTIVTGPSPYDYYEVVRAVRSQYDEDELTELEEEDAELYARYTQALTESKAMSPSARRGQALFFGEKAGCTACHVGANFTDEKYHNLGVGMAKENPPPGHFAVSQDEKDRGAMKTPTVRNVEFSAPYMHDGSQKTLEEVVQWYDQGGHPNPYLSDKIKKLNLSDQEKQDLVAFMKSLSGPFAEVQTGRLPD